MARLAQSDAEQFLYAEARMLDESRYEDWLALMTEDVTHWVPNNDDDIDPALHISIVLDDYKLMEDRIWRISKSGMNHSNDPPSKFVRFITNVMVEDAEADNEVTVRCNMLATEYRPGIARDNRDGASWRASHCVYTLRNVEGSWKIAFRKIMLLDNAGALPAMTYVI